MAFAQLKLLDKENVSLRVKEEHRQKSFTTSSNNTNDSHSERTNDIQSPATICQDANQSTAEKILRFCSGSSVICFDKILDELDDTTRVWNAHTVRPSKNLTVPSGRPNVVYGLPELYHTSDFISPVEHESLELYKNESFLRLTITCDPDVFELCNNIMAELHLNLPRDPYQAVNTYMHLRDAIKASL